MFVPSRSKRFALLAILVFPLLGALTQDPTPPPPQDPTAPFPRPEDVGRIERDTVFGREPPDRES